MYEKPKNAEVIAIFPDKIRISVYDMQAFQKDGQVKVGSYVRIIDNEETTLIAMIEAYLMESYMDPYGGVQRRYILEALPLGIIKNGQFIKGGNAIAVPPRVIEPAYHDEIKKIFEESTPQEKQLIFSVLSSNETISVPVEGDRFFNKHIAIIGSTGSGKSHTVAKILQLALSSKQTDSHDINNSHIVIFDVHAEYQSAFPDSRFIDIDSLRLPYWMMNGAELEDFFVEAGSRAYNQLSIFKEAIVESKKYHCEGPQEKIENIGFDSPVYFSLDDVIDFLTEKDQERVPGARGDKAGPYNGKLTGFINRIENKVQDKRLNFLFGEESIKMTLKDVVSQLIGMGDNKSNITILDLSGIPYDVLNITVSLISRIIFEFGYYYKRARVKSGENNTDFPLLLVYEEAHKYVPNDHSAVYRSCRESIERIAKEGRKYGVTLLLASQRPSEISETIFSQCNNFIALRLTNPTDQRYVKKLLPDSMGSIVNQLPTLQVGEALLTGDAVILPSIVKIEKCLNQPASSDVPYWQLWREQWHMIDMDSAIDIWDK